MIHMGLTIRWVCAPQWVSNLVQLTSLDLQANRLEGLPSGISYLTQLQQLDLSGRMCAVCACVGGGGPMHGLCRNGGGGAPVLASVHLSVCAGVLLPGTH